MIELIQKMERVFRENPIYSKDGQGMSAKVIARFNFPGTSMQWLVTEASKEEGQWILYGYCHIFEWEWGYFNLDDLLNQRHGLNVTVYEENQRSVSEMLL